MRLLGSGGMGEVYLAEHPRLPRRDALKVLRVDVSADSGFLERFNREADLAAKLWHPHIVEIHDRGECEGRLWISMDYVDGTDAAHMLRDHYPAGMPATDAIRIVSAVAEALDYAHARGLLHRDVKPANILLAELEDGERRILLSDFGVARDVEDVSGLTATNMTVGTVAYAAPEQLMALPMDGRADQYSLAATGYHLLTGLTLFPSSNPAVVIGRHLNAPPPTLAERRPYLAPLDAVFAKALAKDPNERFLRCVDFAHALAESNMEPASSDLSDMSTKTPVIPPVSIPKGPVDRKAPTNEAPKSQLPHRNEVRIRRSRLLVAAAVVLVAICVGAYFAVKAITKPAPPAPFSLTGTLQLTSDSIKTTGLPGGYSCAGDRSDNDIGPGATVTVADETGKLIAQGCHRKQLRTTRLVSVSVQSQRGSRRAEVLPSAGRPTRRNQIHRGRSQSRNQPVPRQHCPQPNGHSPTPHSNTGDRDTGRPRVGQLGPAAADRQPRPPVRDRRARRPLGTPNQFQAARNRRRRHRLEQRKNTERTPAAPGAIPRSQTALVG